MAKNNKGFSARTWDFFCSLKLTIMLLLLLAVTSIIGTLIQQNAPPESYIREYGQSNYELFKALQFTDMYHSTWFIGILCLFSVNLVCCSIQHFPHVWQMVKQPMLVASNGILKGSANKASYESTEQPELLAQRLTTLLKAEFAKPVITPQDGKIYLFAQKGIFSRFGAYITHLSILVIMAGAIIGNIWGYKAYVNIPEGQSVNAVNSRQGQGAIPLGFTLRCDDFDVSYYENSNRPKKFSSDLVIIENGVEVLKKRIEVNHPLQYKGLTFYQASYGASGSPLFKIRATHNNSGESVELTAPPNEHVELPNGYSFAITNATDNDRNFGPAIQMHVNTPDAKHGNPFIVWQNHPQFDLKRGGVFSFALLGVEQRQYTGLEVAKDPGVNIVWLGCLMLIFGSLGAFFFSHKRIWVCIDEAEGKTQVTFAANAHRNKPGFAIEFEELEKKFSACLKDSSSNKEDSHG